MFWNRQAGLLRPLLGPNWFNWSGLGWPWTQKLDTRFRCCMVTMRLWTEFFLSDWTPVVLHAHIPLCFRVVHRTKGFLGKWRASARLIPLYTLRTTEEADWLTLLLTNQMCRYTQTLTLFFLFSCVLVFMQVPWF